MGDPAGAEPERRRQNPAAEALGVHRDTLAAKMKKYGINGG